MTTELEQEILRVLEATQYGLSVYDKPGADNVSRAEIMDSIPTAIGPAGELAAAEVARTMDLSREEQEAEMRAFVPALKGAATGAAVATATTIPDIIGLGYGGVKALLAKEGEKGQAFLDGLSSISGAVGSEKAGQIYAEYVGGLDATDEEKAAMMTGYQAGEFGGIPGLAGAYQIVKKGLPIAADMAVEVGKRAESQLSEGGKTLFSGAPIDDAVNKGFAAVGDAVKAARARYEASPNDPTARRAYLDARHERDAQMSSMPVEEKLETDASYRMAHQPTTPQNGAARLDDMTGGGTVFPDDIYSGDAVRLYGGNNLADQESAKIIQSVRGNPEAEITIYRAVPKDVDAINPGDWVTLSKRYADDHAESGYGQMGDEAGKVISQKVKVKDVYSDGNDLNEFGYFPEDIAETNVAKLEPPTEKQPGIIAFHGSGADFDEFKLEKIGTGEGAQAYGYGLYFTDSESIAKFYKNSVATQIKINNEKFVPRNHSITEIVQQNSNDKQKIKQELVRYIEQNEGNPYSNVQDAKEIIDAIDNDNIDLDDAGKMYKVGLEPKPEDMLDYQGTFADQPKSVQDAVKKLGFDPDVQFKITETGDGRFTVSSVDALGRETTKDFVDGVMGQNAKQQAEEYASDQSKKMSQMPMPIILDQLKTIIAQEPRKPDAPSFKKKDAEIILSQRLLEQGVPGIKYRAAGSRAASVDAADAEMNYVIFDDKMIKILEKYGIVGPVAITGVAASQQEGESDGQSS